MTLLEKIKIDAINGIPCSVDNALAISEQFPLNEICEAANQVRIHHHGNKIDTCSIVNARAGKCSENCKWCAQSRFHSTGCEEYDIVSHSDLMHALHLNTDKKVRRLSLVTSGRKIAPAHIDQFCDLYRKMRAESNIYLCASMGLLSKNELQKLWDAGVRRYHCNLETSSDFFPTLCTTHTREDKLATIRAAREVGMDVCSGGIIGMGETRRQRLMLAQEAREAGACSIPVNVLIAIKGTPLENMPPISEEEVILTVALYRLIAPKCVIRTAGGRMRMSRAATSRLLQGGLNGSIVGDMLTTLGNDIDSDRIVFEQNGFDWE